MKLVIDFIDKLPDYIKLIGLLSILASIVFIAKEAIRNKINFKWGWKLINFGSDVKFDSSEKPKRRCKDCILILMAEREKLDYETRKIRDSIPNNQENYSDQKIIYLEEVLMNRFMKIMDQAIKDGLIQESDRDHQYKIHDSLFSNVFIPVKKEFIRAFKENGITRLDEAEFINYIKEKQQTMVSLFMHSFRNLYTLDSPGITYETVFSQIEGFKPTLKETIADVFQYARQNEIELENDMSRKRQEFADWVDEFIGEENSD